MQKVTQKKLYKYVPQNEVLNHTKSMFILQGDLSVTKKVQVLKNSFKPFLNMSIQQHHYAYCYSYVWNYSKFIKRGENSKGINIYI